MTPIEIVLATLMLVCLVLIAMVWHLFRRISDNQAFAGSLEDKLGSQEEKLLLQQEGLHELRVSSIGMGDRIKGLERELRTLHDKQLELADMDPDTRLYSHAVKRLQQGATVEEVMEECELPRAEAELLFSIHGKNE
ncbi:DUF2802 domain-containing protein [Bowmanella dokdonensis]|uniref:DUF2802 domain-containing protein n=1 Tax=Bowmanella dokdonensis TaxID=751969 RepID=A0A939DPA1_9ALTE|nr:DUF2802 domain-containing protein [Bowmanella dokdonensis]MBN7826459.1 DUF2802 domain-containing protein [Bowmanella dokdonensis]